MTDPNAAVRAEVEQFMNGLLKRNPGELEFHQAVQEVAESLALVLERHPTGMRAIGAIGRQWVDLGSGRTQERNLSGDQALPSCLTN